MNHIANRLYVLLSVNILFSIFIGVLTSSLFVSISLFVYLLFGYLISKTRQKSQTIILFYIVFLIYSIYTIAVHITVVNNPMYDFFLNVDQRIFYSYSKELGLLGWKKMFVIAFTEFQYSEVTFAVYLFAVLYKIASIFNCPDILLFQKLSITFLAALIPVYIYKIVLELKINSKSLFKSILFFALFSPLLLYSAQLMRDIHICFLYTLMTYIVLKKEVKFRYLYLCLLIYISFLIRVENGYFAFLFILLSLLISKKYKINFVRLILVASFLIALFVLGDKIVGTMYNTLYSCNLSSLEAASSNSFGVKIANLPIPFNYLLLSIFGQMLPFPIWVEMVRIKYPEFLIVELITPFYWMSVLTIVLYGLVRTNILIPQELKYLFLVSVIYIVTVSIGEFNTRRLMAVYPMILIVYLYVVRFINSKVKKRLISIVSVGLIFLHLVYILIK